MLWTSVVLLALSLSIARGEPLKGPCVLELLRADQVSS